MSTVLKLNMAREIASPEKITIGKDILELMSGAMYVEPLNLFREYVQNAVDSIDQGIHRENGQINIHLDPNNRRIQIRDNGAGIAKSNFATIMTALGGSRKRTIPGSRGFRGVGRLAGMGYCRSLSFQSKSENDNEVLQIIWDCVKFKKILRDPTYTGHLEDVIREVSTITSRPADDPQAFFEVTMDGIVRLKSDVLLNGPAVMNYLSQVSPVPFHPEFRFSQEIEAVLKKHGIDSNYTITVSESNLSDSEPKTIYKPHNNEFNSTGTQIDEIVDVQHFELHGLQGDIAAIGWLAETGYYGAIPSSSLVKGIRLRVGNIQVGEWDVVANEFPEPRFNSWSVGEVHVLTDKIIPNGRRDNFEEDVHYENLLSQLHPYFKKIAQVCRSKSRNRQWWARINSKANTIDQDLTLLESHSLSKPQTQKVINRVENNQLELEELINSSSYDCSNDLTSKIKQLESRLALISERNQKDDVDPLAAVPYQKRLVYQEMLELVYEVSANKVVGNSMIEKLLKRIASKYP